jgi:predicted regulator of Ras-like GTPase activity (Roadblock/LC7/MglB family)
LDLILSRLDSKALQRRPNQQKVIVPTNIAPIFKKPGAQEPEPIEEVAEPEPVPEESPKPVEAASEPPVKAPVAITPKIEMPPSEPKAAPPVAVPQPESIPFQPAQLIQKPVIPKEVAQITPAVPPPPAIPVVPVAPVVPTAPKVPPPPVVAPKPAIPVVPTPSPIPVAPVVPAPPSFKAEPLAPQTVPEIKLTLAAEQPKPVEPVQALTREEIPPAEFIELQVKQVSNSWPEELRNELAKYGLTESSVYLPLNEVDPGIKRGKLAFSWEKIKGWIRDAQVTQVQHSLETILSLPLPVVVPIFMARQSKGGASRKRISVSDAIPDVFKGQAAPAVAGESPKEITPPAPEKPVSGISPTIPVPQPTGPVPPPPIPVPTTTVPKPPSGMPAPVPIAPAPAFTPPPQVSEPVSISKVVPAQEVTKELDLASLFGQPGKKFWTPPEIVDKVCAMPSVKGALVALDDGLLVSGKLPSPLNCETFAAFLPQIYGRITHYTKELKLDSPRSLTINVQDMPIQISKAGNIFIMVISKEGQDFPAHHLKAICSQLEKQSKN